MKINPLNQRVSERGPMTLPAGERVKPRIPVEHSARDDRFENLTGRFSTRLPKAPSARA